MAAQQAPLPLSPAPRLATPRDLVTPYTSERDYGAAANGSVAVGITATGHWNPTTPGGGFRCPECPYIAPSYELLTGHHNVLHRTSGITEL
ncbi:hypothetical protein AAVH_09624 [Aphelenchoides avenae]|nr:hypothetical protein AAVH_09624 [Aphelenchus avenae]